MKYVLIAGGIGTKSEFLLATFKEKYGDVQIVTTEEAKDMNLTPSDFVNVPSFRLTAPPDLGQMMILGNPPSGKERRRARREQERKSKKKRK